MTMANDEIVLLLRWRVIHSAYTTELPRVQIMPFFFHYLQYAHKRVAFVIELKFIVRHAPVELVIS